MDHCPVVHTRYRPSRDRVTLCRTPGVCGTVDSVLATVRHHDGDLVTGRVDAHAHERRGADRPGR